jgi:hypothetical protein
MEPVRYPADWTWARRAVGHGGDVAVVPFQSYRLFGWAAGRTVLDPAPRLLPGDVVVSDRLAVSGRVLRGEDGRAREVGAALDSGPDLARNLATAGIGWVLVEHGTPGTTPPLRGLTLVRDGTDLTLYRVADPARRAGPSDAQMVIVLIGDALAGMSVVFAAASLLVVRRRTGVGFEAGT